MKIPEISQPGKSFLFKVLLLALLLLLGLYFVQMRSALTSPQDPAHPPTFTVTTAAAITPAASANVAATTTAPAVAIPTIRTPFPGFNPTGNPTLLPPGSPEDFRLKRLTEEELVELYDKARVDENILKYEGDSFFLQGSLLSEIFLRFPQRQGSESLQLQWEILKDATHPSFQQLGIHELSVEPLRQHMETALNRQHVSLDGLQAWAKLRGADFTQPILKSEHLFGDRSTAHILQVECRGNLWILVVRQKGAKSFSVTALYPLSFYLGNHKLSLQILNLNGNKQDEIAVTIDNWGPGMAGWSRQTFDLFEWDGKVFQNLMSDPLSLEVWGRTNILDSTTTNDVSYLTYLTGWQV